MEELVSKLESSDGWKHQVRYSKVAASTLGSPSTTALASSPHAVVGNLRPGTAYQFTVRSLKGKKGGATEVQNSQTLVVSTLSEEHQKRLDNIGRLLTFLSDNLDMEPFPEDPEKPDTYTDKALRSVEGVLTVAKFAGLGGKYLKVAQNAWKLKRSGLAALIFREDLQRMVIAISTFVGSVADGMGLSAQDITVGSYYMLWERKRERLLFPDIEHNHHLVSAKSGVLEQVAPLSLVEELAWFSPLARFAYRNTPAQLQWTLRQFPSRHEAESFDLVMCNSKARPSKPAFALMVHKGHKLAVLSIRGTAEADDVVTDIFCDVTEAPFRFHKGDSTVMGAPEIGPELYVHKGMYHAAKWLVDGDASTETPDALEPNPRGHKVPCRVTAGCGMGHAIRKLHDAGYHLVICGHSLGAGVAVLTALELCDRDPELKVLVYGYGTPACVDERLAEACKGPFMQAYGKKGMPSLPGLGSRVTVKNFINRDDMVPRLSMANAKLFAKELKECRSLYEPLLKQDLNGFMKRAKTLWAPNQRTTKVNRSQKHQTLSRGSSRLSGLPKQDAKLEENRLVPPGLIVHSYRYRGTDHASLVDYRFPELRRLETFSHMISDHHQSNMMATLRNIRAVREAESRGCHPPEWESISSRINGSVETATDPSSYVKCTVCKYFVGWHYTGDSESVEIRGSHHCYACGKIVCERCSKGRQTLPEIGILKPVRVCDDCNVKVVLASAANNKDGGLNLGDLLTRWEHDPESMQVIE